MVFGYVADTMNLERFQIALALIEPLHNSYYTICSQVCASWYMKLQNFVDLGLVNA